MTTRQKLSILYITNKGMSVRKAALYYNVPKSTVGDRVSGRIQHGSVSRPPKYLTNEEEQELMRLLIRCASIGFPKTRCEVLSLIQNIVDSKGIKTVVSSGWWQTFYFLFLPQEHVLVVSKVGTLSPRVLKMSCPTVRTFGLIAVRL